MKYSIQPKISFIVGLKNPDYGEKYQMNNLYRTQLFVDNLVYLTNKEKLNSEIIFVEWNSGKDNNFFDKIIWPKSKLVKMKWIFVPHKYHTKLKNSQLISIYEFYAKNVGIRRAKGDFIISTNPDILFSEKLIHYLKIYSPSDKKFYRIDRLDISGKISLKLTPEKRLSQCKKQVFKRHTFFGSFLLDKKYMGKVPIKDMKKYLKYYWMGEGMIAPSDGLHRNASGDFFMMSKNNWYKIGAYAQIPTHSHIDSILCWQAATFGLKQEILNFDLFHIDHDRHERKKHPQTPWWEWYEKYIDCQLNRKKLIINNKDWGLSNFNLKEILIN